MDKFTSMFKISDRDKQLLLIVAAIAIVALSYFFGFQNLTELGDSLADENITLIKTEKDLKEKNNNKDKYVQDTLTYKDNYGKILMNYTSENTQPSELEFFTKVEQVTGGWIKSASFNKPQPVYTFGRVSTSNPNSSGMAYSTDMVGYATVITISYEASYDDWKRMITYVNSYYSKNSISNITASFSEANNVVSGTMEISMYSIKGASRKISDPEFDVKTGTSNIFSSTNRKK